MKTIFYKIQYRKNKFSRWINLTEHDHNTNFDHALAVTEKIIEDSKETNTEYRIIRHIVAKEIVWIRTKS